MDQKLALLATVPLLAGLGRKDLEAVGALCDEVDVPAGRVIARQGSTADAFYVIVDGTVAIERDGAHLRDLRSGEFFGELALLGDVPRTATATCTTACRLLVIGHREFHALLADYPAISVAVLNAVAHRIAVLEPDRAC
jgi:voltage-gated potassium channel